MKKKIVIFAIVLITILSIISILFVILNKKEVTNENTLYSIKFENIQLRFVRYDYTTGQNQTVGVEKSTDNGKTYEKIYHSALSRRRIFHRKHAVCKNAYHEAGFFHVHGCVKL